MLQQREEFRRDSHGFAGGAGVELRDLAARAVKAELVFQPRDFVKRFLARCAKGDRAFAMEHQFEPCRHGVAGESDGLHGGKSS